MATKKSATAKKPARKNVAPKKKTAKTAPKKSAKKPAAKRAARRAAPPAHPERVGAMMLGDKPATIIGHDVVVGMTAPSFTSTVSGWHRVNPLEDSKGKVRILAAVPSLDTDTCDRETRRFNVEASNLDPNIVIYTVSTDFPFRQKAWCGAAGVDRVHVVSDVVEGEFGHKYGLMIKERRYLRRAVFVVNKDDKITYVAYMPVLGQEPDYAEVMSAAKAALAA